MNKIKKIFCSFILIFSFVVTGFALVGCKNSSSKIYVKNVYAMGMVSAVNYFESSTKVSTMSLDDPIVNESTKNTIKQYTEMFEGLLNSGIHPTESDVSVDDKEYGNFSKKITLTVENQNYTMYYNEVVEGTMQEIDEDEIETKTTSFLYGIAIKKGETDSVVLNVIGSREIEVETEKGVTETESELKLLFSTEKLIATDTDSFDDVDLQKINSYLLIEQEVEDKEIEFEYTTKENGQTKSVEIEWENKKGKEELEIKIVENSTKTKYKIKKSDDNKYVVKQNKKVLFYVEKENGSWKVVDTEGKEI